VSCNRELKFTKVGASKNPEDRLGLQLSSWAGSSVSALPDLLHYVGAPSRISIWRCWVLVLLRARSVGGCRTSPRTRPLPADGGNWAPV